MAEVVRSAGKKNDLVMEAKESGIPSLPCVVFAFRFGNADSFVQRFFAYHRDSVARELAGAARCLLAFKEVGKAPAYPLRWAEETRADFYDCSPEGKRNIKRFIQENRVVLVTFQGASPGEIDIKFFHDLGVRTINTEDSSFDHRSRQPFSAMFGKFLLRRVLKRQIHDLHIANSQGQYDFLLRFAQIPRSGFESPFAESTRNTFIPVTATQRVTGLVSIQKPPGLWQARKRGRRNVWTS